MQKSIFTTVIKLAAVGIIGCSTQLDAQTFTTGLRVDVRQIDAGQFEVIPVRRGANGYQYWCAAATYTIEGLRLPSTTPITISQPRKRDASHARELVTYTLNPSPLGIATLPVVQINALRVGHTMSASRAATFCRQNRSWGR